MKSLFHDPAYPTLMYPYVMGPEGKLTKVIVEKGFINFDTPHPRTQLVHAKPKFLLVHDFDGKCAQSPFIEV